jgi:hypothetical protein
MECPNCKKEITLETDAKGVQRGFCDCIGFRRPVIEIIPPVPAKAAVEPAKGEKKK